MRSMYSTRSFVRGWHSMVFITFTRTCVHIGAKEWDLNGVPLSTRNCVGMPKILTWFSMKIAATVTAVFIIVGNSSVNFEEWSIIAIMYWLPLLFLREGPGCRCR